MAEKEERIFVEKVEKDHFPLCVACWTDGENYFCSWDGEDKPTNKEICEKKCPYDHTMTRQEAIKRMAKALRINIVETQAQCSCLNMAETALNALLEAKNER